MVVNKDWALVCSHHAPLDLQCFKCVYFAFCRRFGVMVRFFPCSFLQSSRKVCTVILAFALLLGVTFGGVCSGFAEPVLFQLMLTAAMARVSIVCLLPVLLLPIVLSAFAVSIGLYWLLIPIAFSKAFLFGYLCSGILMLYPHSGPLFAMLFLCVDCLSLPVLCWCWFRCIRSREAGLWALKPAMLLIVGIGLLNYRIVSPFLASLLS